MEATPAGQYQHPTQQHTPSTQHPANAYTGPATPETQMLIALNANIRQGKLKIYEGTVSEAVIAKRRAKNKIARKQRKVNRQNGSGK